MGLCRGSLQGLLRGILVTHIGLPQNCGDLKGYWGQEDKKLLST